MGQKRFVEIFVAILLKCNLCTYQINRKHLEKLIAIIKRAIMKPTF
jgi:hypothetical protein